MPWQINSILITGTRCPLMPQDAAFCAVSFGSNLSRASQNEIHYSAKRGKSRQIEAAKSSRKVVKRDFSTTRNHCSKDTICKALQAIKIRPLFAAGVKFAIQQSPPREVPPPESSWGGLVAELPCFSWFFTVNRPFSPDQHRPGPGGRDQRLSDPVVCDA